MVNVVCPSVRYSEVVDIGIYDGLANTKDRFQKYTPIYFITYFICLSVYYAEMKMEISK